MPGPRNKQKAKKKKNIPKTTAPVQEPAHATPLPITDPGTGPRVRDLFAFLRSGFSAPITMDDPVCEWFCDSTVFGVIEQLLPLELALILHYNRTRLAGRICPACRRFYNVGDQLALLSSEPGSIDDLDRQLEDSRTVQEQYVSGLCSFVCFSLALFNYPGARGAWGRTAEHLDAWTTELLNGPGAGIQDQGMSDLVKMTRNHDLGVGYMIERPWPGAPVVYQFEDEEQDRKSEEGEDEDEDEIWVEERRRESEDELWVEEDSDSSESEPRGRERTIKPLGASYRR